MYPYYLTVRQMGGTMQTAGFKDYAAFLSNLEKAINGEAEAVRFYAKLMNMAPDERQRASIKHAHDDEIKHYKMFTALYHQLTGREAPVGITETAFESYKEGIRTAFDHELEAAELYREMYLATQIPAIRDVFFEAMTDEMEHAQRFAFIYHEL
ncbi:ferritin family protein [Effusibacillus consociatus]|uniref:Ferritin family protein n=1 Tax=Effusibacillus consociatus TaxID=1117041 RepID=A0ABV9Q586_9BACL